MQAAASDCAVLLSSHLVTDLERVCDHLVLLRDGRVRLAGPIDEVMATHHLLVGPTNAFATMPPEVEVIEQSCTDRQTTVLVRSLVPAFDSSWDIRGMSFEDLVLGYLGSKLRPEVAA
jgi:ABC-2 type transport system ATP-binding protein